MGTQVPQKQERLSFNPKILNEFHPEFNPYIELEILNLQQALSSTKDADTNSDSLQTPVPSGDSLSTQDSTMSSLTSNTTVSRDSKRKRKTKRTPSPTSKTNNDTPLTKQTKTSNLDLRDESLHLREIQSLILHELREPDKPSPTSDTDYRYRLISSILNKNTKMSDNFATARQLIDYIHQIFYNQRPIPNKHLSLTEVNIHGINTEDVPLLSASYTQFKYDTINAKKYHQVYTNSSLLHETKAHLAHLYRIEAVSLRQLVEILHRQPHHHQLLSQDWYTLAPLKPTLAESRKAPSPPRNTYNKTSNTPTKGTDKSSSVISTEYATVATTTPVTQLDPNSTTFIPEQDYKEDLTPTSDQPPPIPPKPKHIALLATASKLETQQRALNFVSFVQKWIDIFDREPLHPEEDIVQIIKSKLNPDEMVPAPHKQLSEKHTLLVNHGIILNHQLDNEKSVVYRNHPFGIPEWFQSSKQCQNILNELDTMNDTSILKGQSARTKSLLAHHANVNARSPLVCSSATRNSMS